jgi:queuine/archaeosine tRNA-ribosyltransferase
MPLTQLTTPQGTLELPVFFPDATRAVVKALDPMDLNCRCNDRFGCSFAALCRHYEI